MLKLEEIKLAVIGLGYVGLPLAVEFGKKRKTIGFDIDEKRIQELCNGVDATNELTSRELKRSVNLKLSSAIKDIENCNCFIITVPTPIDGTMKPDISFIEEATNSISSILKKDDLVIYESTVYPGLTEEVCVPILEKGSNLVFNHDFFCGYSPERINPGDKKHTVRDIVKLTSGSTVEVGYLVDSLYSQIIEAGTYRVESIIVAEAAKVIENTQRDLNIALINELTMIFNKIGIDTEAVLKAAETKWNFIPFRPGLVGGHCIGVDPYYLTFKAESLDYNPKIILAGRSLNENMSTYVANQLIKAMISKSIKVEKASVLLMGLSFKENCPDIRNTKVKDLYIELEEFGCDVNVFDPLVNEKEAKTHYGISLVNKPDNYSFDAIVLCVSHDYFRDMGIENIRKLGKEKNVLYDLKYLFPAKMTDLRL